MKTLANFIKNDGPTKLAELGIAGSSIPGVTTSTTVPPTVMAANNVPGPLPIVLSATAAAMTTANDNNNVLSSMTASQPSTSQLQQTAAPIISTDLVANVVDAPSSSMVPAVQSKELVVTNVPCFLNEQQVKQLLEPFGIIQSFTLTKDENGKSTGIARFQYADPSVNEKAVKGLTGLGIGNEKLVVRTLAEAHEKGIVEIATEDAPVISEERQPTQQQQHQTIPSTVLELHNMVTDEELADDEEYEDIKLDVSEECEKTGQVVSIDIPREGVDKGKIFVTFKTVEGSVNTRQAMMGKQFGGRKVIALFSHRERDAAKHANES